MLTDEGLFLEMKYSIGVPNLCPKHKCTSGTESYMLCMTWVSTTALPQWQVDAFSGLGGRTRGFLLSHSFCCWQQHTSVPTHFHPTAAAAAGELFPLRVLPGVTEQLCLHLMQIIHSCAFVFIPCYVAASMSTLLFIRDGYCGNAFAEFTVICTQGTFLTER